ncbi:ROK family protein [Marisediminicola senii]|uniref:ROK family protein n=1 Tax=Marisediminicola senii TaxID=2711233 RepID=UPI0013EC2622|nr:ROK family protein [Marisediminicola senii]
MIAGIETGGTKVICAVSREEEPERIVSSVRITTTAPAETIDAVNRFLDDVSTEEPIRALGIASFGPVNVEPSRARYGWITGTTKVGWQNTSLLDRIPLARAVPTTVVSDVSGAALGEYRWGAGRGLQSVAYATFGTGVGVGIILNGSLVAGNGYPEVGHVLVRRHPRDDFSGICPFHGDCLEGLTSGPAIMARWGVNASLLTGRARATGYEIIAYYIAQVTAQVTFALGVERFIVGGGVLGAPGLLDEVRQQLSGVTGGPLAGHGMTADPFDFLVPPALGGDAGVLGALAIAEGLVLHQPLTEVAP